MKNKAIFMLFLSTIILILFLSSCAEEQTYDQCDFNKDGKVDAVETRRCGQQQTQPSGRCGDGVCDNIEKQKGVCQQDCAEGVDTCGDIECFREKFAACEPTTTFTWSMGDWVSQYYEIIGPKDGLCEMTTKYTVNPNPEWVDKEMTCLYDNSKDLETASTEVLNSIYCDADVTVGYDCTDLNGDCEGPQVTLYIEMTSEETPVECNEPCEYCVSGKQTLIHRGEAVCIDCRWDGSCIEGYECFQDKCISEDFLEQRSLPCPEYEGEIDCYEFECGCDAYECEVCNTGIRKAIHVLAEGCKCVQCMVDSDCADSYVCDKYNCVSE